MSGLINYNLITQSALTLKAVTNNNIYLTTDTHELYCDINDTRIGIGTLITLATDADRTNILAPIVGKLYFIKETNLLYTYNGTWVNISAEGSLSEETLSTLLASYYTKAEVDALVKPTIVQVSKDLTGEFVIDFDGRPVQSYSSDLAVESTLEISSLGFTETAFPDENKVYTVELHIPAIDTVTTMTFPSGVALIDFPEFLPFDADCALMYHVFVARYLGINVSGSAVPSKQLNYAYSYPVDISNIVTPTIVTLSSAGTCRVTMNSLPADAVVTIDWGDGETTTAVSGTTTYTHPCAVGDIVTIYNATHINGISNVGTLNRLGNSLTDISKMFYESSITTIDPAVTSLPPNLTTINQLFRDSMLSSDIPSTWRLPAGCVDMYCTFTKGHGKPAIGTFDITNFFDDWTPTSCVISSMFRDFTNLVGTAPADKLWNSGASFTGNYGTGHVFYGCTNLDNYSDIPSSWR